MFAVHSHCAVLRNLSLRLDYGISEIILCDRMVVLGTGNILQDNYDTRLCVVTEIIWWVLKCRINASSCMFNSMPNC